MAMDCRQQMIRLGSFDRGIHLVTDQILRGLDILSGCRRGMLYLHIMHTSCALTLNENASPDVRTDLGRFFDDLAPDGSASYTHRSEGPDDMPAHIKSVVTGAGLALPVTDGHVVLGTWQGVYLCEFRDRGGERRVFASTIGVYPG